MVAKTHIKKPIRKLAAIMFVDIVGFSYMMGSDEGETLKLLQDYEAIVAPIVKNHDGLILKKLGDGFFCEYSSALNAVECAIEIHKSLHSFNKKRKNGFKLNVRIGIHLGDVVKKDNDSFGDGVNVAARIEPLAPPGGVFISETVFSAICSHPKFEITSIGKKNLKGLSYPHHIYKVNTGYEIDLKREKIRRLKSNVISTIKQRRPYLIAIITILFVTMGLISLLTFFGRKSDQSSSRNAGLNLLTNNQKTPDTAIKQTDGFEYDEDSTKYFHGTGESSSLEEARIIATNSLYQNIRINITASLRSELENNNQAVLGFIRLFNKYDSVVRLREISERVENTDRGYRVTRFVNKEELHNHFRIVKKEIRGLIADAIHYEAQRDMNNALKEYFAALILSHACPDTIGLVMPGMKKQIGYPLLLIQDKIRQVLKGIDFQVTNCQKFDEAIVIDMNAVLQNESINLLLLSYNNGIDTEFAFVEAGKVKLVLRQEPENYILAFSISIEYMPEEKLANDAYLNSIFKNIDVNQFDNSYNFRVDLAKYSRVDFGVQIKGRTVKFQPRFQFANPKSLSWDFGDGSTSNEQEPTYQYQGHGEYLVTLKINGNDQSIVQKSITIGQLPDNEEQDNLDETYYATSKDFIDEIMARKDGESLIKHLQAHKALGKLVFGRKNDFFNPTNKYIIVFEEKKIHTVLFFDGSNYRDVGVEQGSTYDDLSSFKGKRTVWVDLFEANQGRKNAQD